MGIELVEGRDLVRVDHKLWMKTLRVLQRIDMPYRRIEDNCLDPHGVYGLFADLRESFYRLAGIIEKISPHDCGYDFLIVGRML
jgi:uncharacterized circularly permuted ATP-grasp superfamily protein